MVNINRQLLITLRKKAKLTQQDVAEKLGITRSFYGMIETGDRNPTLDLARKIAGLFNVDIEELFFNDGCHELLQIGQVSSLDATGTTGRGA